MQTLSLSQVANVIGNVDDFYRALRLNWYVMPSRKATCITLEWMTGVYNGKFWVMRHNTAVIRPCLYPPTKEELLAILENEANKNAIVTGFTEKH